MDDERNLYPKPPDEENSSDVLTDLLFILVLGQMFVLSWFAHQELANRVSLPKGPLVDGYVQEIDLDDHVVLKFEDESKIEWLESGESESISLVDGFDLLLDRLSDRQLESIVYQADGNLRHEVVDGLQLQIRGAGITVLKQHDLDP